MYNDNTKINIKSNKKTKHKTFFFDKIPEEKKEVNKTEKTFKRIINLEYILIAIMIIAGLIFYRTANTTIVKILLGMIFIFWGLIKIYSNFYQKSIYLFRYNIIFGVISIIISILTLIFNSSQIYFGIWLLLVVINNILLIINFLINHEKTFIILILDTIIILFISILIFINPFKNLLLPEVIGSFLILFSIIYGSIYSLLLKRKDHIL